MKSKIFLQLIIFCFACFSEPAAAAGKITASEAEVWANQKGRQLLDTFSEPDVKTKYAKLDEMFLNDVDLDYVGKFVVGKLLAADDALESARTVTFLFSSAIP